MSATKKMWTRRWHNAVNYVHASKLSHSISDVNFFTVLVFVLQFVIDLFLLVPRVVHAGFTRYCRTTCAHSHDERMRVRSMDSAEA